jgi:hypothetical protein
MLLNPGEAAPRRPTAWHAVGVVVNFAQTSIGSERILADSGPLRQVLYDA